MFLEEGSNVKNFEKKWKYYFQMIWTQLITPATQSGGVRSTLLRTESYNSSMVTDGILQLQHGYGQNLTTLAWLRTESYYSSLVTDGILLL